MNSFFMKQKYYYFITFIIFVVVCGTIIKGYLFPSNLFPWKEIESSLSLEEKNNELRGNNSPMNTWADSIKKRQITATWTPSHSMIKPTEDQNKSLTITQYMFTDTTTKIHKLWALDDHGIAKAVWFYATFWDYFDKEGSAPSMFSCEDVETEWLKQSLKWWKCKRYKLEYNPFSFIFMSKNPVLFLENWKIYIKDKEGKEYQSYEITQYTINKDSSLKDIIRRKEEWLDKKYCLKKYDVWDSFKKWNISWIAWLGEKLNKLYNEGQLELYNIHERSDVTCLNNTPWLLLYQKWSQKFYTVIGHTPINEFPTSDGIYSTPFSIDEDVD